VSKDGDYTSKLNPTAPNAFLADEWKETHESDVFIYEHIGQFFQANFPDQDFSLNIENVRLSTDFSAAVHLPVPTAPSLY